MNRADDFSRLELNLGNCLYNYRYFRGLLDSRVKLLVLVKANAYGHGAVEFASMMQKAGADYLAVAYPIEGVELRLAGISLPIMVLTAGTDFFEEVIRYRLEPGIPNLYTLGLFCKALDERGLRDYPVHLKLDSGMHRLGFVDTELEELKSFLAVHPQVRIESFYSHLAAAEDPAEDEFTLSQIASFAGAADFLQEGLAYTPMRHVLNSAGIQRFPQYQFDMVRLGIGIYGISALPQVRLRPVASLKCKILQIKTLDTGTVGYGRRGLVAPEGSVIATIPVGYADGVDRRLGCGRASFSLGGRRVPTIGNICMDMCMLDVTGVPAKVGDTVTVFGEDPSAEELAQILGTIPYEILTGIPRRIERIIVR